MVLTKLREPAKIRQVAGKAKYFRNWLRPTFYRSGVFGCSVKQTGVDVAHDGTDAAKISMYQMVEVLNEEGIRGGTSYVDVASHDSESDDGSASIQAFEPGYDLRLPSS